MKAPSLRSALSLWVLLIFFCAWCLSSLISIFQYNADFDRMVEQGLSESLGYLIEDMVDFERRGAQLELLDSFSQHEGEYQQLVMWYKGSVSFNSDPQLPEIKAQQNGYIHDTQGTYFFYRSSRHPDYAVSVLLWEEYDSGPWLALLLEQMWPFLLLLPLTLAVLYFAIGRILSPLDTVTHNIKQKDVDQLSPMTVESFPAEVIPLVEALNNLLFKLEKSLEKERRFTSNAAHELLTPLAAIKTEVQLCDKQPEVPAELKHALNEINIRVDRATRTVEQLVSLAKADEDHFRQSSQQQIDYVRLWQEVLAEHGSGMDKKSLQLTFDAPSELLLKGNESALTVLCRNLVDNALRYTPIKGNVNVLIKKNNNLATVIMSNDCRPMSVSEKEPLFQRFVRGKGEVALGSGLGLSLVKQIVEAHHGHVELNLQSSTSCFEVTLDLPLSLT